MSLDEVSMSAPDKVIEVENLGIRLSETFGVFIEYLALVRGEVVVLDAPSGAGKSTVLGLVSGALNFDPTLGASKITIDGSTPRSFPLSPIDVGFVLQTSALIPFLTVEENIALPCQVADTRPDAEWFNYILKVLGIADLRKRKPQQISVGQRQRVGIARAFLSQPKLLLLDEPVSSLDPTNVDQVEGLISHLAEESQSGVILASHQAHRGEFSKCRRIGYRMEMIGNMKFSVFGEAVVV